MKRLFPLCLLLVAVFIVSCKSTDPSTTTHGVDASGNVWMNPPPTGEGIQIAVQPFIVPADSEVQGNFYLILPSDLPFDVGRIEIAMNEGTHHMNLYRASVAWPPDSGDPAPIVFSHLDGKVDTVTARYKWEFKANIVRNNGGQLMVEAQVPYLNWEFPKLNEGPNVGAQTCVHFDGHDTIVIENHYVNISNLNGGGSQATPNGKGKVIINLWKATSAPVIHGSMMFARKMNLNVEVGDHTYAKDCKFPGVQSDSIYLLGMTGHFHSRGKNFWVDKIQEKFDANQNIIGDSVVETIYRSAAWSEPPFNVYDKPIKVNLNKGEFLRYSAEYINTTGKVIPFGPHVAYEEHMNLFVWFVPGWNDGKTVYDDLN
jgi:hypothetical protein